jgi:Leucine-rich repeat (LRR) protein
LSASLVELDLESNDIKEGLGRTLAAALSLCTALTSLKLGYNEALRVNTTLTSLALGFNDLGEGGGRALAETLRLNTTVTSLDLSDNGMVEEVRFSTSSGLGRQVQESGSGWRHITAWFI